MQFSVIIPAFNAEAFICACLASVLRQSLGQQNFEIIVVDDCSVDKTYELAADIASQNENMIVTRMPSNSGPGPSRNRGLCLARGDWVLFVDSDDMLDPGALRSLRRFIDEHNSPLLDAIGFNWRYVFPDAEGRSGSQGRRRDYDALRLSRHDMIRRYLALRMDGSVIYTAVRRELIERHKLEFAPGYHEDVDYIFKIYWHARKILYLSDVLYIKRSRVDSIVGTVSEKHVQGFMRAWRQVGAFASQNAGHEWAELLPCYILGQVAVVATRVREIYKWASSREEAAMLYDALYRYCAENRWQMGAASQTKYGMIAWKFEMTMKDNRLGKMEKAILINEHVSSIINKSWSCADLHHSLFLGPSQIRTCCKRFFVNGTMRGDVSLIDVSQADHRQASIATILEAKQDLWNRINSGDATECDGCPFMEFREWGSLSKLDIRYLSLEYHSVCNLRCTYCSEIYCGGLEPQYDVSALVDELINQRALENCGEVVWGGGEPLLDKRFEKLFNKLGAALPKANQRVLTNAVIYSTRVCDALRGGNAVIVTSIDAGTDQTFALVRGRARLQEVLGNLEAYVAANAGSVTLKYIFTDPNSSMQEARAFCELMGRRALMGCNIQISYDFTKESIPTDVATAMVAMYGLLTAAGFNVVYFDDLLRHRLTDMHSTSPSPIEVSLGALGLEQILASRSVYPIVAIWGAGWQAKYLIEKSVFFKHVRVAFLVDDTPSKIGGRFLGHDILPPHVLCESDVPVVIAAVQGYPTIYRSFLRLGLDPARLVKGLIL
ncbi:MAG: glycosyltransferase [bacterium]